MDAVAVGKLVDAAAVPGWVVAAGIGAGGENGEGRRVECGGGREKNGRCAIDGLARGRTRESVALVRVVSTPTQTQLKFGSEMGHGGQKIGHPSV